MPRRSCARSLLHPCFVKKHPGSPYKSNDLFRRIAGHASHGVGSPWAFVVAAAIVVAWGLSGPIFHFSDTWQLVINTGTTVVTFLMVFLIQNTQNRDSHAIHLKLDELIRASSKARNLLLEAEELTEAELETLQDEFRKLAKKKSATQPHKPHGPQKSGTSNISSSLIGETSSRATNRSPAPER